MPKYESLYPKFPDEAVSRCRPENQELIKKIYTTAHEKFEICQGMEICLAMEYIRDHLPDPTHGFVEIGSAYGGSFYCWASIITGGPAVSVDKAVNAVVDVFGVTTPNDPVTVSLRNEMWEEFFPGRVHVVDGYSQETGTIEQVERILGDHRVDFLFIDGDHGERVTRLDLKNYSRFVRPGGLIGFHDIYHHIHRDQCGKVFREQPDRWETGHDNHCAKNAPTGIGIVRV